jgi:hypothetical protein
MECLEEECGFNSDCQSLMTFCNGYGSRSGVLGSCLYDYVTYAGRLTRICEYVLVGGVASVLRLVMNHEEPHLMHIRFYLLKILDTPSAKLMTRMRITLFYLVVIYICIFQYIIIKQLTKSHFRLSSPVYI